MGKKVAGVGVCPVGCRLTLPLWCPARGLGGWGCRLTQPLACFSAPIPLPPFPAGRGRFFCFLMQGASPLASPGLNRKWHWDRGANHAPGGGRAFLVVGAPCLQLTFFPPSPCPPSRREGGIFCFLMQGASPLASPGLSRKWHWDRGTNHAPGGGRAFLVAG